MRRCLWWMLLLLGCDDGAGGDPMPIDGGPFDMTPSDMGLDQALDMVRLDAARPDQAVDATLDAADVPIDMPPNMPPDMPPARCVDRPSPRPDGAWRVRGCDLITTGDGARVPRGVVVSADSLVRNARTPLHTAAEYRQLADLGLDWVWLLVTWDGIMPLADTVNGAYLGRVCEQIGFADAAGLKVVIGMYQRGWGPALGGHGAPAWATPANLDPAPPGALEHPSLTAAWQGFWADPARLATFEAAWTRLIETCAASTGIIGVQPLAHPRGDPMAATALFERVRAAAEDTWGPLLLFVDGDHAPLDASDVVHAPTIWTADDPGGPVRALAFDGQAGIVRGASLDTLSDAEAAGVGWMIWHDGFGTDAFALRDMDGRIGPDGLALRDRIWPKIVGGSVLGFGATDDGFSLRYIADGRNAGLTRLHLPADATVELLPVGVDGFTAYDPLAQELSVFVQGAAGPVEVRIR